MICSFNLSAYFHNLCTEAANEPNLFVLGGHSINPQGAAVNHGDLCPPGKHCDSTLAVIDQMAPVRPLDAVFSY